MGCFASVDASEKGLKQDCGKYVAPPLEPGCHCLIPFKQRIRGVSLQIRQLDCNTHTKTVEGVTMHVSTAVQWHVDPEHVDIFYFKVSNPEQQIHAYVDDIIRSELTKLTLDEAYAEKQAMGVRTQTALVHECNEKYGIEIVKVLIVDLKPSDPRMANAMNDEEVAKREMRAADARGEAKKVMEMKEAQAFAGALVLRAEAEMKSQAMKGEGLAEMRKNIAKGFKNSIVTIQNWQPEYRTDPKTGKASTMAEFQVAFGKLPVRTVTISGSGEPAGDIGCTFNEALTVESVSNGPAKRAGVIPGWKVVDIEGKPVAASLNDLQDRLASQVGQYKMTFHEDWHQVWSYATPAQGPVGASSGEKEMSPEAVAHMMLVTQYLDVLNQFAESGRSTIMVPHGMGAVQDMETSIARGFISAQHLNNPST